MRRKSKNFMALKTKFSKSKKSAISIQFNWMLILIVGGLILLIFISIARKQKEVSEVEIAGTIQTDLQAVLASSYVSVGTASVIDMPPNQGIKFSCDGGMPGFKLGTQAPARFPYSFSPDSIKSERNTISVFAYDWSVPFRVTNFLYVTSPDVRYVIVSDANNADLVEKLEDLLPPQYIEKDDKSRLFMNRIERDLGGIAAGIFKNDKNNYKTKFIFVNVWGEVTIDNSFRDSDVSAVQIGGTTLDSGTLNFYDLQTGLMQFELTKTIGYAGEAAILAAIYSENSDVYECGMDNALKRLKTVTGIYITKAEQLSNDLEEPCKGLFSTIDADLQDLKTAAVNKDYNSIATLSTSITTQNENLQANSCPPLY